MTEILQSFLQVRPLCMTACALYTAVLLVRISPLKVKQIPSLHFNSPESSCTSRWIWDLGSFYVLELFSLFSTLTSLDQKFRKTLLRRKMKIWETKNVKSLSIKEKSEIKTKYLFLISVFSLFSIVTFKNQGCASLDPGRNGTCYTNTECNSKGGSISGNCAAG